MDTVLTFLAANRQRLELAHHGVPERLASVVITPRFRASSHVVFLIVAPGNPDPLLVAKLPRLGGASASVEREVANLRAVQAGRDGGYMSVPRVIAFEEYLGRPILVETALVGRPMDPATVRRDRAGCCNAVTEWLAGLPQPAAGGDSDEDNWFSRLVDAPLRYFQNVFPLLAEEERLLERTWELVAPLRDAALPVVFEHGDLSHPNILLLRDGSPGVVDWELAEPRGLPTYDLFFFLTYVAFATQNAQKSGDYLAPFHSAFFGRSAWARPYADAYARRLHLPLHTLTPLFVLGWARYISNLLLRLDAERAGGRVTNATATWLRANRYYALWRHAVKHASALDWQDLPASSTRSS
jgi:aminoglycoside phosphotransferase (APT) family kinase protein